MNVPSGPGVEPRNSDRSWLYGCHRCSTTCPVLGRLDRSHAERPQPPHDEPGEPVGQQAHQLEVLRAGPHRVVLVRSRPGPRPPRRRAPARPRRRSPGSRRRSGHRGRPRAAARPPGRRGCTPRGARAGPRRPAPHRPRSRRPAARRSRGRPGGGGSPAPCRRARRRRPPVAGGPRAAREAPVGCYGAGGHSCGSGKSRPGACASATVSWSSVSTRIVGGPVRVGRGDLLDHVDEPPVGTPSSMLWNQTSRSGSPIASCIVTTLPTADLQLDRRSDRGRRPAGCRPPTARRSRRRARGRAGRTDVLTGDRLGHVDEQLHLGRQVVHQLPLGRVREVGVRQWGVPRPVARVHVARRRERRVGGGDGGRQVGVDGRAGHEGAVLGRQGRHGVGAQTRDDHRGGGDGGHGEGPDGVRRPAPATATSPCGDGGGEVGLPACRRWSRGRTGPSAVGRWS